MRATGGNDVNFAMDAPKLDSPDVARMRAKGAISLAVANAAHAGGAAAGPEKAKSLLLQSNLAYGAWGGQPCNPYDTTRVPRGSSSGSGVAIGTSPRGLLVLRADRRLVQGAGFTQRHREPADHQRHHDGRRIRL